MGIANDILNLRDNHSSSVVLLLGALDQVRDAPEIKRHARSWFVNEAVRLVLTNVAAHAAEALADPAPISPVPKSRRPASPRRQKPHFDSYAPSHQRILFALN